MKTTWCTHMREYYSAIEKEAMPFAETWMDLETIILSEVSQTKTNTTWQHLHVELKICHKGTYLPNRDRLTDTRELTYGCQGAGCWGWEELELGISRCQLLYIGWINKVLLYSTGNYIQYPVTNRNGKEYEKECIYIHNNHFAVQQKLTKYCKSTILQ